MHQRLLKLQDDGVTPYVPQLYANGIVPDLGPLKVYRDLLVDLQKAGYQPGVSLFTFPYDWRLELSGQATLLDAKVQAALAAANGTDDPSQWTITKVNLIGHSLGGQLAREYVSSAERAARVHRIISIGAIHLGAPTELSGLLFGNAFCSGVAGPLCPLDQAEAKDLMQNMAGPHEALPSAGYWEFYDGSDTKAFREDRDFDGDGLTLGPLDYTQTKAMLFRLDRDPDLNWNSTSQDVNQSVFKIAEKFHKRLDSSWDAGIPVPEVDLIAGTELCTVGQIRSTYAISATLPFAGQIQLRPVIRLYDGFNGDNTVPLFSAALYDPARNIDHRGGANVFYVDHGDHAGLASLSPVRQLVLNLLSGNSTVPKGISTQSPADPRFCLGTTLFVESPVELHVTDAAGDHTGLTTLPEIGLPAIEQGIPGSRYDQVEESKYIYLPEEGVYTATLRATDAGSFNLGVRAYRLDGLTTMLYLNVPLTPATTGELVYNTASTEPPVLYLDDDGDGVFDPLRVITATSVLGPGQSDDLTPPVITIFGPEEGVTVVGAIPISWQTMDDLSGLLSDWGVIDAGSPSAVQVANGSSVTLPVGEHTLTVFAEDRAGNVSQKAIHFIVYPFRWFPPVSKTDPYMAQVKRTIPIEFSVHDLASQPVRDQSVTLQLLDDDDKTVAGPFFFSKNPASGVAILGDGRYHADLRTEGLPMGTYTLQVTFHSDQLEGQVIKTVILRP